MSSVLRRPSSVILLMCLVWCGSIFVSFVRWNQQVEAPHGRLLFPMLGAFALLLVAGLAQLPRPRLVMGAVSACCMLGACRAFVYIRPAYAWPELVPADARQSSVGQRSAVEFALWR